MRAAAAAARCRAPRAAWGNVLCAKSETRAGGGFGKRCEGRRAVDARTAGSAVRESQGCWGAVTATLPPRSTPSLLLSSSTEVPHALLGLFKYPSLAALRVSLRAGRIPGVPAPFHEGRRVGEPGDGLLAPSAGRRQHIAPCSSSPVPISARSPGPGWLFTPVILFSAVIPWHSFPG